MWGLDPEISVGMKRDYRKRLERLGTNTTAFAMEHYATLGYRRWEAAYADLKLLAQGRIFPPDRVPTQEHALRRSILAYMLGLPVCSPLITQMRERCRENGLSFPFPPPNHQAYPRLLNGTAGAEARDRTGVASRKDRKEKRL